MPIGDTLAVKQAMQAMNENSELRKSLSESANHTSKKFTWKEAANEHLKLYQKVKNL